MINKVFLLFCTTKSKYSYDTHGLKLSLIAAISHLKYQIPHTTKFAITKIDTLIETSKSR